MKSRNTKQKEILNQEVLGFSTFFTAEELHDKACKKDARLGIATVYRFLKETLKKGEIHSYTCNRKTVFSIKNNSHCHFVCEKCGKSEHINVKSLDFIENKLKGSICHFQIDVSGICDRCS